MHDTRNVESSTSDVFLNMAIDEALFRNVNNSKYNGTLRFYQNKSYSVTLGFFQNISLLDRDFLRDNNIDYVRRITGGRTVLHGDDLTFSYAGRADSLLYHPSIPLLTKAFAEIIIRALGKLNIRAHIAAKPNICRDNTKNNFHCFNTSNRNEILVGNKKVVGLALKMSADSFLLQGSILLYKNDDMFAGILKGGGADNISNNIGCVNEFSDRKINSDQLIEALISSFCDSNMRLISSGLTKNEEYLSESLKNMKYKETLWNDMPKKFKSNMEFNYKCNYSQTV